MILRSPKSVLARKVLKDGSVSKGKGKLFNSMTQAAIFLQENTETKTVEPRSLVTKIGRCARGKRNDVFGYNFQLAK